MSETKNSGDKTLTVAPKTLSLKRPVEQGVVRQSFSHGRSKAVVVEKVKRRAIGPAEVAPREPAPPASLKTPAAPAPAAARARANRLRQCVRPQPGAPAAAPAGPAIRRRSPSRQFRCGRKRASSCGR